MWMLCIRGPRDAHSVRDTYPCTYLPTLRYVPCDKILMRVLCFWKRVGPGGEVRFRNMARVLSKAVCDRSAVWVEGFIWIVRGLDVDLWVGFSNLGHCVLVEMMISGKR